VACRDADLPDTDAVPVDSEVGTDPTCTEPELRPAAWTRYTDFVPWDTLDALGAAWCATGGEPPGCGPVFAACTAEGATWRMVYAKRSETWVVGLYDSEGALASIYVRTDTDAYCDGTSSDLWLGRPLPDCERSMDPFSAPDCGPALDCGS
jgi:hypothetical protein